MPSFKYADGAIDKAKEEGLHLVVLAIDGKNAKKGTGSICGPVGPKTAAMLWEVFHQLCDVKKRME